MDDVLSEGYWRDSPWDCPFWVNPCRQVVSLCIKRLAAGRGYRQSRQVVLCQHIPTDSYTGTLYLTAAITDICTYTPLTAFYTGTPYLTGCNNFPLHQYLQPASTQILHGLHKTYISAVIPTASKPLFLLCNISNL